MSKNILHVAKLNKFIPPFVDFVADEMPAVFPNQQFFFLGNSKKYPYKDRTNISHYGKGLISYFFSIFALYCKMMRADRVVLHGLFDKRVIYCLFFQPWSLKKCYWVIWGKDLYTYQDPKKGRKWRRLEFFRRKVIRDLGFLVTYVNGDVELARKWYGAKGKHLNCIMYTTNLFSEVMVPEKSNKKINIQIGNSADPSNNHFDILDMLEPYKDENIAIYAPLSYGNKKHAASVIEAGHNMFGDKFFPMLDFMPFEKYLAFLGDIDIAVFNHKRQQGMGNIISLLGMGKKVYFRSDVTSWEVLDSLGLNIYDVNSFSVDLLTDGERIANKKIIRENFSREKLADQLKVIFEG
ncbi:TDP-N-acetylfucosamine:lipid II N-acetylfucosaminyltransferase [Neptunomonas phycophila]|uniref:TDP-N-acetylfucosamine:lipid II N-acetylfucosaminyltransferase n=1 Tax=Neptunomonas phycophila TaxID=1572645 RepID=UPI0026E2CA0F|nr:TDP-N-acetylfucosamine:lipid II N-acetylfucosaminyltransferase [Neptunomonas phycophila]MDO6783997.1 TDP-N-acetylfucosamine:lipid II N-acetylfucosaminyltransferase [Neptunomonas phycophila]